jgi:hypothetical protein
MTARRREPAGYLELTGSRCGCLIARSGVGSGACTLVGYLIERRKARRDVGNAQIRLEFALIQAADCQFCASRVMIGMEPTSTPIRRIRSGRSSARSHTP